MTILVVGDEMVDKYWVGKSTRNNPDGPQPLVHIDHAIELPGGAGNVKQNLESMGVELAFLTQAGGRIVKNRVINDGKVVLRFDEGSKLRPATARYDLRAIATLHPWSAVVVADYAKGTVDDVVAEWVRSLGKPTYVDCKVHPERWAGWVDCMFPNLDEHEKNSGIYDGGSCSVMVKRGPRGCTFRDPRTDVLRYFPSDVKDVVNPTGAGDAAMAAFVVASMAGSGPMVACEFAMAAAAVAVEAPLTYAPTLVEIAKRGNLFAARQLKNEARP